jgi:hypothetical protein
MAELLVDGDELVLHLSTLEELASVHGDLRAPLAAVTAVEVLEDAHEPADAGFHGAHYYAWIVGCEDPEAMQRQLNGR